MSSADRRTAAAAGGISPMMMALVGLLAYKQSRDERGEGDEAARLPQQSGGPGGLLGGLFPSFVGKLRQLKAETVPCRP